jgi:hypothetical protein
MTTVATATVGGLTQFVVASRYMPVFVALACW